MRAALERWLAARWYGAPGVLLLLLPLEWLYRRVIARRRARRTVAAPAVPVIVVGNITVGGSGKTPLVIWLVETLRARGLRVGVLSRGYGGSAAYPLRVDTGTPPAACGDEPALVARRTGAVVFVDPVRVRGLAALRDAGVDVVVSDDGLQHYALPRSVEIAVVDGRRMLGNGHCLPVGPLREPPARLGSVDFVVCNGGAAAPSGQFAMTLVPGLLRRVDDPATTMPVDVFLAAQAAPVAAVAGIGDPSRFFDTLRALRMPIEECPFPDHHAFRAADFAPMAGKVVVMTAKDAVKCAGIAGRDAWYLDVDACLPDGFLPALLARTGLQEVPR